MQHVVQHTISAFACKEHCSVTCAASVREMHRSSRRDDPPDLVSDL
jgi:hypothetical protein